MPSGCNVPLRMPVRALLFFAMKRGAKFCPRTIPKLYQKLYQNYTTDYTKTIPKLYQTMENDPRGPTGITGCHRRFTRTFRQSRRELNMPNRAGGGPELETPRTLKIPVGNRNKQTIQKLYQNYTTTIPTTIPKLYQKLHQHYTTHYTKTIPNWDHKSSSISSLFLLVGI